MIEYKIAKNNVKSKKRILKFLTEIDGIFPVNLSDKVDLNEYVNKIFEKGIIIISEFNNEIVGVLTGYINDKKNKLAYISVLGIKKEYQRRNIGKKLLHIFEQEAKKQKMTNILLYTHKENVGAIKFYEREGYIMSEKKANYDYSVTLEKKIHEFNILITSVGRRGYLVKYFKEVLGEYGQVHVANSSNITPAFQYADKTVVTPLIYDQGYIDFIIKYCKENDIKLVISLFDIDLPVLAKNHKRFERENIKLIVSNEKFVDICNDKWKTYKFLKEIKINVPKTYLNFQDLKKDIEDGIIKYPIIIKPRWGMGSISVLEAENEEELHVLYKKVNQNIKNTYLKYESEIDIKNAVIFQEKLKGEEYGLDVINDLNGNYIRTIAKKKYGMRSGETDCAKTVKIDQLETIGRKISENSKHVANLDVDAFIEDGKAYVLEMNARFGGGYPFSHMADVNLPKAIIMWANNEKVNEDILTPQIGVLSHKDINIIKINEEI